ncbi:MAG: hypothetical protein ABJB11_12960 [Ferruginibacter sp.]
MIKNYTSICHYCGKIYKSNRSTSKYCCSQHNALYHLNGCQIQIFIQDHIGVLFDSYAALNAMYLPPLSEDRWSKPYDILSVFSAANYLGTVPLGEEYILSGKFLIKRIITKTGCDMFCIKPFNLLTKEEKISRIIEHSSWTDQEDLRLRKFPTSIASTEEI